MIYQFESYRLDTERRDLCRGGERVVLEPQVFDVLEYLIRNRERLVSKDDLIASVWNGRIVSDPTLSSRIVSGPTAKSLPRWREVPARSSHEERDEVFFVRYGPKQLPIHAAECLWFTQALIKRGHP